MKKHETVFGDRNCESQKCLYTEHKNVFEKRG